MKIFETFSEMASSVQNKDGEVFVCRERGSAEYVLQPSAYLPQAGDVTFANGRVGALQLENGTGFATWFGAKFDGNTDDTSAIQSALDRLLVVILPVGEADISDTLIMDKASQRLIGQGKGGGGASNSSLYKQSATKLNWVGATGKPVIHLNPAGTAIKWGMQARDFAIFGNSVANVDGILTGAKTAGAIFTDIEIHGVRDCLILGEDAYSVRMYNIGTYEYSGWGFRLTKSNHNALFSGCQINYCLTTNPEGGVVVDGGPTAIAFVGCDFEPFNAPVFVWLKKCAGVVFDGCYFEARDANTEQFIKFGDNGTVGADVKGAAINGCTIQGKNLAREAFMIQQQSSGIVIEGNHIFGMATSLVNNATPGVNNTIGNNWISTTPALFVGGSDGFYKETVGEEVSDITGITTDTGILDTTHTQNGLGNRKRITATVYYTAEDAVATNVNVLFVVQKWNGSAWNDLGQFNRAKLFVNAGTRGLIGSTMELEEVDNSVDTMFTSSRYRVEVRPGTDDDVDILAGSTIKIEEIV